MLSDGGLQRYKLPCGLGVWEGLACVQHWPDCPLQHWLRDEVVFVQQKAELYILALRGALWEAGLQVACAPHASCKMVRTALLWEGADVQKWGEMEGEVRESNMSAVPPSRGMRGPTLLSRRVLSCSGSAQSRPACSLGGTPGMGWRLSKAQAAHLGQGWEPWFRAGESQRDEKKLCGCSAPLERGDGWCRGRTEHPVGGLQVQTSKRILTPH